MKTGCLLLSFVFALTVAPAQDDVLAVERREDVRGRDACVRRLKAARGDIHIEAVTPRDLCRLFAARMGDKVNFSLAAKASEVEGLAVTLQLRAASLWSAMAITQEQTGLRFVYRCGVVFLVPEDAIQPFRYVVVYDLRPQCARLRNFPGPDLRLREGNDDRPLFPPEEEAETTVSGFTADGIEMLIKTDVTPEQWGTDAASLTNNNGLFVVRHSPLGHRQLQELLIGLGLIAEPRVFVRRDPPPVRTPPQSGSPDSPR